MKGSFISFGRRASWLQILVLLAFPFQPAAGTVVGERSSADPFMAEYFKLETAKISASSLDDIHSLEDWQAKRGEWRRETAEMLGLNPTPERSDLKPVITGTLDGGTFTVEKLYFESRPHLYVTANLYLPKGLKKPAPAVLYLCGHTEVKTNGISYGNKVAYQHHAVWFARNGYVCLIIDTLQYGEIEGHHAGTYSEGAWWWNSRGYTPAGVETWNAIRALDYLVSRPEVDATRMCVTGRSGGGAYSWFLAALDDRVKVIAPVAGITDLENYVVDGTVEDHCDCMFLVNTYRWDYPLLAALSAPRPLLLANTDTDAHFPLTGVLRTYGQVKHIYRLYQVSTNFGLVIGPGPHVDSQNLQVPVFRWFNRYLKQEDPLIDSAAVKLFSPAQLKVFTQIPTGQINTTIEYSFVPKASPPQTPTTPEAWRQLHNQWMTNLQEKCFAGWPTDDSPPRVQRVFSESTGEVAFEAYDISCQPSVMLRLYLIRKTAQAEPSQVILHVAGVPVANHSNVTSSVSPQILEAMKAFGDDNEVRRLTREVETNNAAYAVFFPRGLITPGLEKTQTQMRRRFMLLGQTLDGMRVWDIRRAIQALHSLNKLDQAPLQIEAGGKVGVDALYASLFEPDIHGLDLRDVPSSHMEGPDYLNVLKYLDIPEVAAMAAERCSLRLQPRDSEGWDFLNTMAKSEAANLKLEMIK
jgi:dienelactone hydrolase